MTLKVGDEVEVSFKGKVSYISFNNNFADVETTGLEHVITIPANPCASVEVKVAEKFENGDVVMDEEGDFYVATGDGRFQESWAFHNRRTADYNFLNRNELSTRLTLIGHRNPPVSE